MLLWRRSGGQHTVFPWLECLSHTQDLSLSVSLSLSSALALTSECCVTSHWWWWRLPWYISPYVGPSPCPPITHLKLQQPEPATKCVYASFFCFSFYFFYYLIFFLPSTEVIHQLQLHNRTSKRKLEEKPHQFDLPSFIFNNLSGSVVCLCIRVYEHLWSLFSHLLLHSHPFYSVFGTLKTCTV